MQGCCVLLRCICVRPARRCSCGSASLRCLAAAGARQRRWRSAAWAACMQTTRPPSRWPRRVHRRRLCRLAATQTRKHDTCLLATQMMEGLARSVDAHVAACPTGPRTLTPSLPPPLSAFHPSSSSTPRPLLHPRAAARIGRRVELDGRRRRCRHRRAAARGRAVGREPDARGDAGALRRAAAGRRAQRHVVPAHGTQRRRRRHAAAQDGGDAHRRHPRRHPRAAAAPHPRHVLASPARGAPASAAAARRQRRPRRQRRAARRRRRRRLGLHVGRRAGSRGLGGTDAAATRTRLAHAPARGAARDGAAELRAQPVGEEPPAAVPG
ncbi:hypothetical protein FA09DRAFT_68644 [Tilletiopsis washingtonensis]|uniref:Uncharacterized protein n=1 Tax=Tilletiopsis washingtonensis TaxID=58919 RepID=A0A316Z4Y9_9BASI|nr:hypothetical protein FA09DRAFT_68644 [Tilletiopsis washingtonensis]PWN96820.1 hypothetical protein FA09DRAFT_68644 [Tilletiopsis washingtonensis]